MEGEKNITRLFFSWWYGEAYNSLFSFLKHFYAYLYDLFSVSICLKTLFLPWKRDMISYQGLSLQQAFQVWTLNMSSRFIGAIVKILTLASYVIATLLFTILAILSIFVWFVYPIICVALLILGIVKFVGI